MSTSFRAVMMPLMTAVCSHTPLDKSIGGVNDALASKLGFTDAAIWTKTEQFMRDAQLLAGPVDVNEAFTNEFIK